MSYFNYDKYGGSGGTDGAKKTSAPQSTTFNYAKYADPAPTEQPKAAVPSVVRKPVTTTIAPVGYDKIKADQAEKAKANSIQLDEVTKPHQAAQVVAKQADPKLPPKVDSGTKSIVTTARKNNYEYTGSMTYDGIQRIGNNPILSKNPIVNNLQRFKLGHDKLARSFGDTIRKGYQVAGQVTGGATGITPAKAKQMGEGLGYKAPDFVSSSPVFQEPEDKGTRIAGKIGEFYGMALPGELAERLVAKSLGKQLGKVVQNKIAQTAIRGAAAGGTGTAPQEIVKVATGQESAKEAALNVGLGTGLGAAGGPLLTGIGKLASLVGEAGARRIVDNTLNMTSAIEHLGPEMKLVEGAKRSISDIDEQIGSLSRSKPSYAQELESLNNERKATIDYVKQHEPDYVPTTSKTGIETAPVKTQASRGFGQSLEQSPNVTQAVKESLPTMKYEVKTNEQSLAHANERIARDGVSRVEADLLGTEGHMSAEDITAGIQLLRKLQSDGTREGTERAVTIAEHLSRKLTDAGQTVQAASILNRLSPDGALISAQRRVAQINKGRGNFQKDIVVTLENAEDIKQAATVIQSTVENKDRAAMIVELMDKAKAGTKLSADEHKAVQSFLSDLKQFGKKERVPIQPKELKEPRFRDRILSHLEEQANEARALYNAKRNLGFAAKMDEPDIVLLSKMAAHSLAKKAVTYSDWAEQMVKDFGKEVSGHLESIYERAMKLVRGDSTKVSKQSISKAERIAESFMKTKQLGEEDVTFIRGMAQKVSGLSGELQKQASQDLQYVLNSFERAGVGRKLSAMFYIAKLLNPLTQVKNIAGNELLYRLERINRMVATPIDVVYSAVTGKPRTVTWKRGPSVWDNFYDTEKGFLPQTKDFNKGLGQGIKAGWKGVNPEGLESKYEIGAQAWSHAPKNVVLKSVNAVPKYLEKTLGASLQGFDYAAYTRATQQRLSETAYLDAINAGVKGKEAIREHMRKAMLNMDSEAVEAANKYGKYVTLQDKSELAKGLTTLKRTGDKMTGGNFGIGTIILPFAKTPANITLRALDYSPAGFIRAIGQSYKILNGTAEGLTRGDVMQSISRTLLGTGFGAGAYWLADKGALFGTLDSDKDVRNLQKQSGRDDFQLNATAMMRMIRAVASGGNVDAAAKIRPGDQLFRYDWAAPASMPMAIAANLYDGVKGKKTGGDIALDSIWGGTQTVLDQSPLSSLTDSFKTSYGDDKSARTFFENLGKKVPGMFMPTVLSQLNMLRDNQAKETYDPDVGKSFLTSTQATIPGLAQKLPGKVDTLGHPVTKANSLSDVFFNPAKRSVYKPSQAAQTAIDAIQETGDKQYAPRVVPKSISGTLKGTKEKTTIKLSPDQFTRFQTIVGQETERRINNINPALPPLKKADKVKDAIDKANELGRKQMKKELGLKK